MRLTLLFIIPFGIGLYLGNIHAGFIATVGTAFITSLLFNFLYYFNIPTVPVSRSIYDIIKAKTTDGIVKVVKLNDSDNNDPTTL